MPLLRVHPLINCMQQQEYHRVRHLYLVNNFFTDMTIQHNKNAINGTVINSSTVIPPSVRLHTLHRSLS